MNSRAGSFGRRRYSCAIAFCFALTFSQLSVSDSLGDKLKGVMKALAKGAGTGGLIVNGGFEEPVVPKGSYQLFSTGQSFTGWQVMGAPGNVAPISGEYAKNGIRFPAQGGKQWLDMTGLSNSATGVQQTVHTQPGTHYELSFFVGNVVNGGGFGTTSAIEVLVDGQSAGVFTHEAGTPRVLDWRQFTVPITATATSTTIAFVNRDSRGDDSNGLDSVSLRPAGQATAPATANSVNGDYTYVVPGYQGQGVATVTQIEDDVHIYTTWTPMGKGPHAEFKGKLKGDTITGEWYSLRTKQGWFKFVGQIRPNGDIDFSQTDDPINSNTSKVVLTKAR